MKRISVVVACLVGTAVIGASACYADEPSLGGGLQQASFPADPAFGTWATAASTTMSPLLAREVAVFTSQGISPARAIQAIEVRSKVAQAKLVHKVEAALPGAYAGAWLEPATAQVHLGATSPTSRHQIEAAAAQAGLAGDVTVTPVRSTLAALLATQKQWNHRLANLFAREEVETSLEEQRNAVSVTLGSSVPASERAALIREAAHAKTNVIVTVAASARLGLSLQAKTVCKKGPAGKFVPEEAFCEPSITSGTRIANKIKCSEVVAEVVEGFPTQKACEERTVAGTKGKWIRETAECTAGPIGIPEADKKQRVLLTAGHCIDKELGGRGINEKWEGLNTAAEESTIGPAENYSFGVPVGTKGATYCGGLCNGGDFGDILIEAAWQTGKAKEPVFAVTAEWKEMNEKKEETSYPVKGEEKPMAKASNCHEGERSGESCGEIKATNVTLTAFVNGKTVVEEGLVEDAEGAKEKLVGEGGDSGGPWLAIGAKNEVNMEGTHVGIVFECEKVANQKGEKFFKTESECRNVEVAKGGEGEWERKAKTNLLWMPLKQPVKGAAEGPLERLKLELLTTANEVIPANIAFQWKAGEKSLEAGETREFTAATDGQNLDFHGAVAGVSVLLLSSQAEVEKGAKIAGGLPGTGEETLVFSGVTVDAPSKCLVETDTAKPVVGTLKTNPLKTEIVENRESGEPLILITPSTGTAVAGLLFVDKGSETCAVNGVLANLTGSLLAQPLPQLTEALRETVDLEASTKNFLLSGYGLDKAGLSLAGKAATVTGLLLLTLTSDERFGAF
jgi:hypothetical protein